MSMKFDYKIDPTIIESINKREHKWMERWLKDKIYEADRESSKDKIFITFPYPYMNGSLHLGHAFSSGRLDVLARYYRLKGYNVLYPWAWHWTGEAVFGTIHRLLDGDESVKKRLIELDGVNEDTIIRFSDPIFFVRYFTNKNREVVKRYGLSIDWRREFHTTSLHPLYNKFVEWQIRRLFKKGYITKGTYPAVWCPRDKSPTGDHDRLKGEGVRPEEYTLVKFILYLNGKKYYLVAGTFRPETLYGVTNIWVNPQGVYVVANVDGEEWIISKEAAYKLSNQLHKVEVINTLSGVDLIGLFVKAPLVDKYIPILPASFVDTDMVTGVVYSVPAHAPYDYLALEDLKRSEKDLGIKELAMHIKPISIIKVEGYGEYPAIEEVERRGIKSQTEYEKADLATQEIYKKEYHKGVMKDNCGPVSGLPVREAKEIIKSILSEEGLGASMYDLPEEVICRCGTKCIVKILEDQWYLQYSNERWKKLAHEAVDKMNFYPPEIKKQFHYLIDWYEDWPCTRKSGLGTPFPFDKSWIVETLTDSTVYMAFYIIAKYYNQGLIDPERIDDSFFDYIFLGEGDLERIAEKTGLSHKLLEDIRKDFLYWYPVDLRGSGKDLIGNHLTFFIFHHVAIFPRDLWPRGISVNGYVMLNGKEMSKSKGNYISMEKAIQLIGSDALRLSLLTLADGLDDPDWSVEKGINAIHKLNSIYNLYKEVFSTEQVNCNHRGLHENILLASYNEALREIEDYLKNHMIANAGKIIFFKLFDVFKDYLKVTPEPNYCLLRELLEEYTKIISIYTPYIAEEIWHEIIGKTSYISNERWPVIDKKYLDTIYIDIKEYANEIMADIKHILNIVKEDKKKIYILYSDDWKWKLIKKFIDKSEIDLSEFIDRGVKEFNIEKKSLATFGRFIQKEWHGRYMKFRRLLKNWDSNDERLFFNKYLPDFLKSEFSKYEIVIASESDIDVIKLRNIKKEAYPIYPIILIV